MRLPNVRVRIGILLSFVKGRERSELKSWKNGENG